MKYLAIFIIIFSNLFGQNKNMIQQDQKRQIKSEYYFTEARQNDTIQVNLWGEVKRPGVYYLSKEVDLITLLSLAEGPTKDANFSKIKIITGNSRKINSVDITPYINKGKNVAIPLVPDNSVVIVPSSTSSKIYHYLSWVSRILGVFSIYFMIRYYYISG